MTKEEIMNLVNRSLFASVGYTDETGRQNIRRVFCVWHKGLGRHLISTNTSSAHVQSLMKNGDACLYFSDDSAFEGFCLFGKQWLILKENIESSFGTPAMKSIIQRASRMKITASWSSLLKAGGSTAMTGRAICRDRKLRHLMQAGSLKTDILKRQRIYHETGISQHGL